MDSFWKCSNLTNVNIPDSVQRIDKFAFDGCSSLTTLNIGNGVQTIGEEAFNNCLLKDITIPQSVTSIGSKAFGYFWDRTKQQKVKYEDMIIRGISGSAAETYARENGFTFIPVNDVNASGWVQVDDKWYYIDKDSTIAIGWRHVGGKWYYMNKNGSMLTGWQNIGGKWYYMNKNGDMADRNTYINGTLNRFNSSGAWLGK